MKRMLLFTAFMLCNFEFFATYNVGSLNTVANGGQGFGDGLPALGYLTNESAAFYGSCLRVDGSIVAVGQTTDNDPCLYVYNADGLVDTNFAGGAGYLVYNSGQSGAAHATSFLVNSDIIVVGSAGDQYLLWQVLNNGPDTTVDVQANVIDQSIDVGNAVLYDGTSIYVIGTTTQQNNGTAIFIAKYDTAGNLQTTYNSGAVVGGAGSAITQPGIALISLASGDLTALGASFDNNGNIVVVGSYAGTSGVLCRFTLDGLLDTTFGDALTGYRTIDNVILQDVGVQSGRSSNCIVACGTSTTNGMVVNRFDANGTTLLTSLISLCGSTAASANSLAIDLNDKIIIGGTAIIGEQNNFLIARLDALAQSFDTTFGTNGYTVDLEGAQGSFLIANSTYTSTNYILTGYNDTAGIVAEYLGDLAKGIIDRSFGTDGELQIAGGLTTAPEVMMVTNSGDLIVGVESDKNLVSLISNYTLNTNFGVGASGISPQLPFDLDFMRDMITDNAGNIYIVGDNGGTSSLSKLSPDGSEIIWSSSTNIQFGTGVVQQASGRIVICGYSSEFGSVLAAYDPNTGALDSSFNQASEHPGYYILDPNPTTVLQSISIVNGSDKILIGFQDQNNLYVQRLLENGSLDTSFPATGTTTWITGIADPNQMRMQQDVNGKIVVVGNDKTNGFIASRYRADGTNDVINVAINFGDATNVVMKDLVCLSDGTTLILGYNVFYNTLLLAHLNADFTIDIDFGYLGLLQTAVTSPVSMTNFYGIGIGSVEPYNILISATDGNNPYLVGIVSGFTSAVTAVNQSTNSWGPAGTLDTTYNYNSGQQAGFVDLTNEIATNLGRPSSCKAMVQLDNGSYFVLSDNGYQIYVSPGTDSYLTKFNADDTQDMTFGTDGVLTISGMKEAHDLIIDQQGNLIVVGMLEYPTSMIVAFNAADGSSLWDLANLDFHYNYVVVQQSNGRILVAGAHANGPAIQAFNPNTGAQDITFGNNGIYTLTGGYGFAIHDLVLDAHDNIYCMADKNNVASTFKISPAGTELLWTSATTIPSSNSLFEQIVLQQNGNVIVTSVGSDFATMYFDSYDGLTGISTGSSLALNLYDLGLYRPRCNALLIDQTTPQGNIIVCGGDYENSTVSNTAFVARILPDLSGFDTTYNSTGTLPGVQTIQPDLATGGAEWNNIVIDANGKITACGYGTISSTKKAYLMRLYGNDFITQYSPVPLAAGVPGTIDQGFATNGYVDLAAISGPAATQLPQVVVPTSNGYQYVAFDQGAFVQFNNGTSLSNFGDSGYGNTAPAGAYSMIIDSADHPLLAGTNGSYGWVARYTNNLNGNYDPEFNEGYAFDLGAYTTATQVLEQTMGRIIVAGEGSDGNARLWALTSSGQIDTTFNSNVTPGYYSNGNFHIIFAVVADQYDRLIFANYANAGEGTQVDLTRLTASGQVDTTFGNEGTISGVIANPDDASQIRIALDASGNIVVAAHTTDESLVQSVVLVAYNQNGQIAYQSLIISGLTNPVLTGLIATSDGKILVSGNQISDDSDSMDMWIARVQDDGDGNYELDTTFAPEALIPGIMQFHDITSTDITARNCTGIAIYPTGEISMIGYENNGENNSTFMSRAYNNPYGATQEQPCQLAKPIGTNDLTFGCIGQNEIVFQATESPDIFAQQAQAIALQDDQNIVLGINYQESNSSTPSIMINMFDVDGSLNTDFNSSVQYPLVAGQSLVLDAFDGQYVQDMLTFTTIDGVHKALLAGYVTNNSLESYNSLLLQYILDPTNPSLDGDFGGISGDLPGIALGTLSSQAYTVGRQSNGRIIVGGLSPANNNLGLLQAYTSQGLLDQSFGQRGYLIGGGYGLYATVIDAQDRIVIAYQQDGSTINISRILADGSGLDTSFNQEGQYPGIYSLNLAPYDVASTSNVKVVVDQSGNVIVAVVGDNGDNLAITIAMLDTNGNFIESNLFTADEFGGLTNFVMTQLLVTAAANSESERIILVGYDNNDALMIASFTFYEGEFVQTWDFNSNNRTSGYIKYAAQDYQNQQAGRALIHPDGRIIIAGAVSGAVPS